MTDRTKIGDGKYEIEYHETTGGFAAYRNGEFWRDLVGDNLILAMFCELQENRVILSDALKALEPIAKEAKRFENNRAISYDEGIEVINIFEGLSHTASEVAARIKAQLGEE